MSKVKTAVIHIKSKSSKRDVYPSCKWLCGACPRELCAGTEIRFLCPRFRIPLKVYFLNNPPTTPSSPGLSVCASFAAAANDAIMFVIICEAASGEFGIRIRLERLFEPMACRVS